MQTARALVTGGAGFIGSHLVKRLRGLGAEVHASSRRPHGEQPDGVRWHLADLTDSAAVGKLIDAVRPDVVFHLAGMVTGSRDPGLVVPMMHANLTSAVNLMSALADPPGTRLVLAGSVEEAAIGDKSTAASFPYTVAKWAATGYARMFHQLWGLPVTVLRIAMTYGPDQPDDRKLVPYVIRTLLEGERPKLSSGGRLVDWIYVDDVVDAFIAAAESPASSGAVIDIGSGDQISVRDTVELIRGLVGSDVAVTYGELADRPLDHDQVCDPVAASRLLGWRPATGLDEGLRRTVSWYERRNDRR